MPATKPGWMLLFVLVAAGRAACIAKLALAVDTPKGFARRGGQAEQAGYLYRRNPAADLQLLGANICLRCRRTNWPLRRRCGLGLNQPFPARAATFHVEGPRCATAFPDLRLPMIVVGWNCEDVGECGRDDDSAEHSNQKQAHHLSRHTSLIYPS